MDKKSSLKLYLLIFAICLFIGIAIFLLVRINIWYLIYIAFLIVFIAYSTFTLTQLEEYSYVGDMSRSVMIIYITISLTVIIGSIISILVLG